MEPVNVWAKKGVALVLEVIRAFPTIIVLAPDGSVKSVTHYSVDGPSGFIAKIEEILGRDKSKS